MRRAGERCEGAQKLHNSFHPPSCEKRMDDERGGGKKGQGEREKDIQMKGTKD